MELQYDIETNHVNYGVQVYITASIDNIESLGSILKCHMGHSIWEVEFVPDEINDYTFFTCQICWGRSDVKPHYVRIQKTPTTAVWEYRIHVTLTFGNSELIQTTNRGSLEELQNVLTESEYNKVLASFRVANN